MNREELIRSIVTISVFGLVFSVWCICVILWAIQYFSRRKAMQTRLGLGGGPRGDASTLKLWLEASKQGMEPEAAPKPGLSERLAKLRYNAGWKAPTASIVLLLLVAAGAAAAITYALLQQAIWSAVAAGAIIGLFYMRTEKAITKREALFEKQLVDALGIAARALRAGHPLSAAFGLIGEEIGDPVGSVFRDMAQQQSLGRDMKEAVSSAAAATFNSELKLFATSVCIQLDSGGNLADLMDSLSHVMRARIRLNRRVRVLTAQTQLSKRLLIAIPIALFLILNFIGPEYMSTFFTDRVGHYMLAGTVVMMVFGAWVMHRLSVLRY